MYRKIIFSLFSCFVFSFCLAQEYHEGNMKYYTTDHYLNMVPESPQASSFNESGNLPVNTSKGLPQISIPLYNLEVDGVSIPIVLEYDASGVRVEDVATSVGLKWNLNVGGLVSRDVVDKPDAFGTNKWIHGKEYSPYDTYLELTNPTNIWFREKYKLARTHVEAMDIWPDNFRYSFLDYSNSFKFKPSGSIVKGQTDRIDLWVMEEEGPDKISFEAKDFQGNKYFFGKTRESLEHTSTFNQLLNYTDGSVGAEYTKDYTNEITGWYLDKINTKNNEEILFTYDISYLYTTTKSEVSQKVEFLPGCGDRNHGQVSTINCIADKTSGGSYPFETGTRITSEVITPLIQQINTESIAITFHYEDSSVLPNNKTISGWSKRLVEIVIEDKILNTKKVFGFKYDVFFGDARLKLTEVYEKSPNLLIESLPSYRMVYNESKGLPTINSKSKDIHGYFNDNGADWLYPLTKVTFTEIDDVRIQSRLYDRNYNPDVIDVGILKELHYPTGGYTSFEMEPNVIGTNRSEPKFQKHNINLKSNASMPFVQSLGELRSGYKVASFLELDELSKYLTISANISNCPSCGVGNLEHPTLYIYEYEGDTSQPINYNSLGTQVTRKQLPESEQILDLGNTLSYDKKYVAILNIPRDDINNTTAPVGDVNLYLSFYAYKRAAGTGGGGIEYHPNYLGGLRIKSIKDIDENNKEYHLRKYQYQDYHANTQYDFLSYFREVDGTKTLNSELMPQVDGKPVYNGFTYTKVVQELYDRSIYIGKEELEYLPKHSFNTIVGGELTKKRVFNASNKLVQLQEWEIESKKEKEFSYRVPSMMEVVIHPMNMEIQVYTIDYVTYDFEEIKTLTKQIKSTEINYEGNTASAITNIEKRDYNEKMLPSRIKVDNASIATLSNNDIVGYFSNSGLAYNNHYTDFTYAVDYSELESLPKGLLIHKGVFKNNTQISGNYYTYDNKGNLLEIYEHNKGVAVKPSHAPSYIPNAYEHRASIHYDKGRPVMIELNEYNTVKKGVISYLWGYHNQFVVAKIPGIAYSSIARSEIDNIASASLQGSTLLNNAFDSLRSTYSDYPITTIEYHPLFGVKRITQPNGLYNTYEVDGYGRLIRIRDFNDFILQEYKYNYKR